MDCPCCSKKSYNDCCGPLISGKSIADTPEALMRSRYTAYTEANIEYIAKTMRGKAAEGFDLVSAAQWAKSVKWLKCEVLHAITRGAVGWVEFKAIFHEAGETRVLYERSTFEKSEGIWFYVEGHAPSKISRNSPCFCGSTKKYKRCCAPAGL